MKVFNKRALSAMIQIALLSTASTAVIAEEKEVDDGKLEVITVTALKRTQSIQEVPVSIATLSGEKFENMFSSGDDILALATKVPGLYAESSNGRVAPRFYLRGLGNTDFDLAASQPVSIIMDEVVMENVVLKSFPLFDVDQVEVIRGPQGTLFGRNTTAGIIKFTSRKPTDDFEAYVRAGVGTYGLQNFEGAVGGGLTDTISARLSVLNQSKDDWIDNGYTNEADAMGGHKDEAVRLQVAFNPTDELDILFNYHTRSLEGTSSIFRANVLSTGKEGLNSNYDRDKVYFDAGDNNPQEYDNAGWSLNVNYDLGEYTLTSITAIETAEGRSLGDIDGGVSRGDDGSGYPTDVDYVQFQDDFGNDMVTYPGFIPFGAVTEDQLDDLEQFTQEIRISSNQTRPYSWQAGVFFFDSSFKVTSIDGFFGATEVFHENTTWAVFGQSTYHINDQLSVIGGLRYTEDEKSLSVGEQNKDGFALVIGVASIQEYDDVNVSDGQWSWEGMVNYQVADNISVYGRLSNGFRAQSIQGRDIAFEGFPSTAAAETIMSYEAGFKSDLIDNTLRLNGAVFHYTIDDIQLTAVGGNGNNIGLTNAGKGEGNGFEVDAEFRATENLTVTAGYSLNKTELMDKDLRIATCGSGACTPTDPLDADGNAIVHGNPFPNAPESIFTATARYTYELGNDGELFLYSDYAYQGKTNLFIYETKEYVTDGQFELGLRVGYIHYDLDFEVAVFGRNITDEDNLKAGIDFNNNTGVVNEPAVWGIEFKKNFY